MLLTLDLTKWRRSPFDLFFLAFVILSPTLLSYLQKVVAEYNPHTMTDLARLNLDLAMSYKVAILTGGLSSKVLYATK